MANELFNTYLDLLAAELTHIEFRMCGHIHLDEYLRKARATVKPSITVIDLIKEIERKGKSLIALITTNPQAEIAGLQVQLLGLIDELRVALQACPTSDVLLELRAM